MTLAAAEYSETLHYPQYTLRRDPNRGTHDGPERTGPSWLPTPLPLTYCLESIMARLPPDR